MHRKRYTPCNGSGKAPVARLEQVGICPTCGVRTFLEKTDTATPVIQRHLGSRTDIMDFTRVRDMKREVNRRAKAGSVW